MGGGNSVLTRDDLETYEACTCLSSGEVLDLLAKFQKLGGVRRNRARSELAFHSLEAAQAATTRQQSSGLRVDRSSSGVGADVEGADVDAVDAVDAARIAGARVARCGTDRPGRRDGGRAATPERDARRLATRDGERRTAGAAVVQGRRARRPGRRRGEAPGARGVRVVLGRGQGAAKASDARAREGARARREERARGEIAAGVFR